MEQVLFVLNGGKISQWNLSRGKLEAVKSHGLLQVPYSSKTAKAYWDNWKEDNQVVDGDVYDAIFLSGDANGFGELPKWICADSDEKSAWTFEQLSLLAAEAAFTSTGLCLVQGKDKRLVGTDKADTAVVLQVKSSLVFALPKDAPMPVAKPAPKEVPPPLPIGLAADCLGSDEKAQALKAGDVFCGTMAVVSKVRGNCYVDSERLCQQMRIRYADLSAYCQTVKRGIPSAGDRLEFKVVSVSQLPSRIDLKLEIID